MSKLDTTELKRRMSTPAHPDGDPTLMVVEIARITKERDALREDKARLLELCKRANELLGIANVCMDGWQRAVAWHNDYKAAIDAAKGGAR
jgi:hypothetical protein